MPVELLALLASLCWAFSSLFSAGPAQRLGAFAFSRWRMLFAAALLWLLASWSGGAATLQGSAWLLLAISGVIGISLGDTALFACMNRLGPRRSGILFATHALMSAVLAWAWLDERLSAWGVVGAALLVSGVMLAVAFGKRADEGHGWEKTQGSLRWGVALGLLAALCQAVATLMLKPLMSTGVDAVAASAMRMSAALGAHLLLVALWQGARAKAPIRRSDLFHTGMSALLAMVVGMTLILQALKHGQANLVALLSSVTPVMILPLLWVVYRKPPAWGGWAGAAGVVAGTSLLLTR